jgi:hypothetical protein
MGNCRCKTSIDHRFGEFLQRDWNERERTGNRVTRVRDYV